MKNITRIHASKQGFVRHHLKDWLAERRMDPMDLLNALNENSPDGKIIDKSQVYRWLKGNLPHPPTQARIAAVLQLFDETGEPDPQALTRHPNEDWIARKVRGRSPEEIERMKTILNIAFPDKTGT